MHVLVVEDEVKMAALIRRGLSEQGLTVDVTETGEDAIGNARYLRSRRGRGARRGRCRVRLSQAGPAGGRRARVILIPMRTGRRWPFVGSGITILGLLAFSAGLSDAKVTQRRR